MFSTPQPPAHALYKERVLKELDVEIKAAAEFDRRHPESECGYTSGLRRARFLVELSK